MGIRWKTFEMPNRLEVDQATLTPTYAKFYAEPFERGYGKQKAHCVLYISCVYFLLVRLKLTNNGR